MDELRCYLNDNTQAWLLQSDGSYRQVTPDGEEPCSAQITLLNRLAS